MNGEDLPKLNGYPLRLVVPGYYGTYWVKHLSEITVVENVFDGFWMSTAYRVPDTIGAGIAPGTARLFTREFPWHRAFRKTNRCDGFFLERTGAVPSI